MKKILLMLIATHALSAAGLDSAIAATHAPWKRILTALYAHHHHQPFWTAPADASRRAALLDLLDDPYFNYKNKPFNRATIDRLLAQQGSDIQPDGIGAKLDVALSEAYVRLLHFVRVGDVDWALVQRKMAHLKATQDVRATWEITPHALPDPSAIASAIERGELSQFLEQNIPLASTYKGLIAQLQHYQNMPDFPDIPYGKRLQAHSFDDRLRLIKKKLQFFGDYRRSDTGSGWNSDLTKAVRSFRERLNLSQGDYIDNKTILYLNKPRAFYLRKILTNLDILKLYPHTFESEYVEINVPDFRLRYYQQGREIFRSPIVVGRIDRPTPIFSDAIEYLVLNPTWAITNNLVRRDLIPVLKRDPGYLATHNIHVFSGGKEVPLDRKRLFAAEHGGPVPYRFVQFPGEKNALGRVKFMFPNQYAVYLHDTDNKTLFQYRYRVFSSGCMRVGKPFELMRILLRHAKGTYSESRIQKILETNKPTTIHLTKPIPVHILYRTAYREGNKDYFLYDIYMYEQMIYESSEGHVKPDFTVPKKRLTGVKRVGRIHTDTRKHTPKHAAPDDLF